MKAYTKADIRVIELYASEPVLLTNSMIIDDEGGDEQLTRRHDWEADNNDFWKFHPNDYNY